MILESIFQWPRQWLDSFTSRCQFVEPLSRCSLDHIDSIQFDPMAGRRNVEVPTVAGMSDTILRVSDGSDRNILPCRANTGGLRIVRGILCADTELEPTFSVDGQIYPPESPGMVVLGEQVR